MAAVLWLIAGVVIGFEVGLVFHILSLRRINRTTADLLGRVRPYVGQRRWPW